MPCEFAGLTKGLDLLWTGIATSRQLYVGITGRLIPAERGKIPRGKIPRDI